MTCRAVEHFWRGRLDEIRAGVSSTGIDSLPGTIEEHLARCPRCRGRAAGFGALARAIGALEAPATPNGLSARVLEAVEEDRRRSPATLPMRRERRVAAMLVRRVSVAAAVLIVLLGLRAIRSPKVEGPLPGPGAIDAPALVLEPTPPPRPLNEAVAEVAELTAAIARRTSVPAARFGRDVFGAASVVSSPNEMIDVIEPGAASLPATTEGRADRVVKVIGDRINSGVKPLSTPTRSAFSFLVPSLPPADEPATPGRGA